MSQMLLSSLGFTKPIAEKFFIISWSSVLLLCMRGVKGQTQRRAARDGNTWNLDCSLMKRNSNIKCDTRAFYLFLPFFCPDSSFGLVCVNVSVCLLCVLVFHLPHPLVWQVRDTDRQNDTRRTDQSNGSTPHVSERESTYTRRCALTITHTSHAQTHTQKKN